MPGWLTAIPAATLASRHDSTRSQPEPRQAASTATTVSPAPVTSATSRICAGMWTIRPSVEGHPLDPSGDQQGVQLGCQLHRVGGDRHRLVSRQRPADPRSASIRLGVTTVARA